MGKIKVCMEKHHILSVVFSVSLAILILMLIFWMGKKIFAWTGNEVKLLLGFIIEFACSREYRGMIVDAYNVTQFRIFNALIFYLTLCLVYVTVLVVLKVIIIMVVECIEGCINKMDDLILGKKHQRSLEYTGITLWYIKCKADVIVFGNWIRRDIFKIRIEFREDNTLIEWVRLFSFENLVVAFKNIVIFFFELTPMHLVFSGVSIYTYFESNIIDVYNDLRDVMVQNEITSAQCIDFFEVVVILCLLGYIVFDIRHKASGYANLREKRFEELIQMEEDLLNILCRIRYSLNKNIRLITENKGAILSDGAYELSGKGCYFCGTEIIFENDNNFSYTNFHNSRRWLSHLDDMEDEFNRLSKLEKRLKKSSLNYLNIYLVDYKAMLTKVTRFWILGVDDKQYKKMQFFCKTSMKKWYENNFMITLKNSDEEKRYYSESETVKRVLEVSSMLDYEVERAFELELYMKKYERKMIKRFRRINNFSRFNLN